MDFTKEDILIHKLRNQPLTIDRDTLTHNKDALVEMGVIGVGKPHTTFHGILAKTLVPIILVEVVHIHCAEYPDHPDMETREDFYDKGDYIRL